MEYNTEIAYFCVDKKKGMHHVSDPEWQVDLGARPQGTYLHSLEPAANLVDLCRKREVRSQRGITHNIAKGQEKRAKQSPSVKGN